MIGLSAEIELGIQAVIDGLNYDISLDHLVRSEGEYVQYVGYNISINCKDGTKKTGEIIEAGDDDILIRYYIKQGNDRIATERRIKYIDIKDARVSEKDSDVLEADKMKAIINAKIDSFTMAKQMLNRWVGSPNSPSKEKLRGHVEKLVTAGDKALQFLREALAYSIDYDALETHKIGSAIRAKPIILSGIFELDGSINELRVQLESNDLNLGEKEFKIGYPERFAKGDFYPATDYHKEWYNEEEDAVMICPFGTKGEIIELDDLKIQLPKVPKKKDILFHDLPKKEQYWRRQDVPDNITPDNVDSYDAYVVEEYRRRREGIWFMNNGKPVYLTGNMYFALQWCLMLDDKTYMSFRIAQLNMFYHLEACIRDPRCLGQVFLKSRRTGFTYVILSILMNMATSRENGHYGMTSKSGEDAQKAFNKFSYMFQSLPFFFRPVVKGKEDSPSELYFGKPSNNSKEAKKSRLSNINDYLNTTVDHLPTKNDSYDSIKLNAYLGDEAFKWVKPHDYITHLGMVAPTMMPNGRVVGKAFIGSTMGARAKGGSQGIELILGSKVKERDPITQKTSTALYSYFLPAHHNMEDFTDKYGVCHIVAPKEETYAVTGKKITIGAEDYLIATEEQKARQSDKAANEQYRTYPRTVEHAMRDESSNCVFNLTKLYDQLNYNRTIPTESKYVIGNFGWKDGITDGDVQFNPDKDGRFKISWMPSVVDDTIGLANNVKVINGKFYPMNENTVRFGCDPFSLKSTHGKGSKGGIHGKTLKFPEGGAPSNKFVLEYLARPASDTTFFEDVIMMCRYYGAPILVESNRIDLLRHMRNRGYRGFAMNRVDRPANKLNDNEKEYGGQVMSGADILDSHMNAIGSWVQDYVGKSTKEQIRPLDEMGDMPFDETLRDWIAFDPNNRTEYDATISSGLAIMACQTEKYKPKAPPRDTNRLAGLIATYNNNGNISTLN